MYIPDDLFKHIFSFFPKKKHFKFHSTTFNCDLHYLIQRLGMNRRALMYPSTLLTEYIQDYYLTDNNYLQNKHGNTPLHLASQYNIFYQVYNLIKDIAPKMAYVKNNQGYIPVDTKSIYSREFTYC